MPLDPRAKRFLDRLAALNPPSVLALTVSERRTGLSQMLSFAGPGSPVGRIAERTLEGPDGKHLVLRIYTPMGVDEAQARGSGGLLPALVYFHGGGLVAGTLDTHDPICRALSNATGCVIISVDYRLAPEHPFPAAISDGCHATTFTASHARELGIDPDRIGICGDSAGATLAAVVCQTLSASGAAKLALQFLLCPIMDFCAETDSRRDYAAGYLVDQATLEHDLKYYLGADGDPAHPRVSPLRATDVSGLPPTCIHTAEFDPLRDEGAAYAARLQKAGIKTTYRCHSGMIHLFYGMGALIPYAATAYQLIGTDIRSLLGKAQ
ncbi:MAG TPA: alpha/beta hydrolase [Steroidobacteraceae bacterium]